MAPAYQPESSEEKSSHQLMATAALLSADLSSQ